MSVECVGSGWSCVRAEMMDAQGVASRAASALVTARLSSRGHGLTFNHRSTTLVEHHFFGSWEVFNHPWLMVEHHFFWRCSTTQWLNG